MSNQPLSVILLASDAAAHVEAVLAGWAAWLEARGKPYDLLLVDDASGDGTADKAEGLALPRLRVLRHAARQGEGAALRTGLAAAERPLLFYTLCHPDYRPEDLGRLLDKPMPEASDGQEIDHVHMMGGFRAGVPMPAALRALGWAWRAFCLVVLAYRPAPLPGWLGWRRWLGWLLARAVFAIRHHDVACPFRLFRREVVARIPIQSDSAFAHVELLAKANFLTTWMSEDLPLAAAPPAYRGDWGAMWRDARRVFDKPDFGPAAPL